MMTEQTVVDSTEVAIDKLGNVAGEVVEELASEAVGEVVGEIVGAGVGETLGDSAGELAGETVGKLVGVAAEGISEKILEDAIKEVRHELGSIGIKPTTLSIVIKYTMEAVENTPIKGKDQMNYALLIINNLVNELDNCDEKTLLIQMLDNGGIKDTIELVVDASKGNLKINKVAEVAAEGCLGPCFNYVKSSLF